MMSKLRENLENEIINIFYEDNNNLAKKCELVSEQCEQITDDFSVKLLIWMANLKHENDELKHIDYENSSDEQIATEISKTFKENFYER